MKQATTNNIVKKIIIFRIITKAAGDNGMKSELIYTYWNFEPRLYQADHGLDAVFEIIK